MYVSAPAHVFFPPDIFEGLFFHRRVKISDVVMRASTLARVEMPPLLFLVQVDALRQPDNAWRRRSQQTLRQCCFKAMAPSATVALF